MEAVQPWLALVPIIVRQTIDALNVLAIGEIHETCAGEN